MKKPNYRELSSLALAYIGDAVYEVMVRQHLLNTGIAKVQFLHKESTKFVSAKSQSRFIHALMDELTEEEKDIVRRGRNTKSHTTAKNASVNEYRYSTAFECLIGYLYLTNQQERLEWVFEQIVLLGRSSEYEDNKL
nr:Mini-ribonuclease 3 [Desulfuribacillus alkaliarsenatis]